MGGHPLQYVQLDVTWDLWKVAYLSVWRLPECRDEGPQLHHGQVLFGGNAGSCASMFLDGRSLS